MDVIYRISIIKIMISKPILTPHPWF